jgi:UDP-glucuronate 4-epimerase
LVTGGAGFIGSHLIDSLLQAGAEVVCIDAFHDYYDPSRKRANVGRHLVHDRYRLVEADIRDAGRMRSLVAEHRPEVIVHLAARAGVRASIQEPYLYQEVNVGGTLNLLEAARCAGVKKFINASSSSVYGENPKIPFAETDALLCPTSPYAASKLSAEALVHVYARQYGFTAASLRFFTVYGPRQRPDMAISKFSSLMLRGKPIEIYGDGTARRDFTYVEDIVRGIRLAADVEFCGHQLFNLGCAEPVKLTELVDELERALAIKAERLYGPTQPGDVPLTYSDISKARRILGYVPQVSLRQGLQRFARSLSDQAQLHSLPPQSLPLAFEPAQMAL